MSYPKCLYGKNVDDIIIVNDEKEEKAHSDYVTCEVFYAPKENKKPGRPKKEEEEL